MAKIQVHQCTNCGAALDWKGNETRTVCPYCLTPYYWDVTEPAAEKKTPTEKSPYVADPLQHSAPVQREPLRRDPLADEDDLFMKKALGALIGVVALFFIFLVCKAIASSGVKQAEPYMPTTSVYYSDEGAYRVNPYDPILYYEGEVPVEVSDGRNEIYIAPRETESLTAMDAGRIIYNGEIAEPKQEDKYAFVAPGAGMYYIEASGIMNGTVMKLEAVDELGDTLDVDSYLENGDGLYFNNLETGQTCTLKIRQYDGLGNYTLTAWMPKEVVDVTGFTEISDSIEYAHQQNEYTFTAPTTGLYHIWLREVYSGFVTKLEVCNSLNESLEQDSYCENNDGVTVELSGGETYRIRISQYDETGTYILCIGIPKEILDIQTGDALFDQVEFEDEMIRYRFTPEQDGFVTITFTEMNADMILKTEVVNHLGEVVDSDSYTENWDCLTFDADQGETYTVRIRQMDEMGGFRMALDLE